MIIETKLSKVSFKMLFSICFLFTSNLSDIFLQIINFIMILMFLLKKNFNIIHTISIKWLKILTRISHSYDKICYITQIKIKSTPFISFFIFWNKGFDWIIQSSLFILFLINLCYYLDIWLCLMRLSLNIKNWNCINLRILILQHICIRLDNNLVYLDLYTFISLIDEFDFIVLFYTLHKFDFKWIL
jgi:hypothetical protein